MNVKLRRILNGKNLIHR